MTRANRSPRRGGAAAVELAVTLPLLAVLASMVVDFARVFHTTQVLTTAADNGVAHASGTACDPGTADPGHTAACVAGASLVPPLRADQVTVAMTGGVVTVTVEYDHPLFTGFLYPGGTVALRRTATRSVRPSVGQ